MTLRARALTGLCLFCLTGRAYADLGDCTNDTTAKAALELQAVSSHYVQALLNRIEEAIDYSSNAQTSAINEVYKDNWLPRIRGAMNDLVDSNLDIAKEAAALREQTACLAVDNAIVEAAIEEVRCELNAAYDEGRGGDLPRLMSLLEFTRDRHRVLLAGWNDPSHEDLAWHRVYNFEDAADVGKACARTNTGSPYVPVCSPLNGEDCLEQGGTAYLTMYGCLKDGNAAVGSIKPDPNQAVCPFTSDYLSPMAVAYESGTGTSYPVSSGYGCDETLLYRYTTFGDVAFEYQALQSLMKERDAFVRQAEKLGEWSTSVQQGLGIFGPDYSHFGAALHREHRSFAGCFEQVLDDPDLKKFIANAEFDTYSGSNLLYQLGLSRWDPRGPFSFAKDDVTIVNRITALRTRWGERRQGQTFYRIGRGTYGSAIQSPIGGHFVIFGLLSTAFQRLSDSLVLGRIGEQAIGESAAISKISDAPVRMGDKLSPVSDAVSALSKLAADVNGGTRGFARGLAWYVRRSCIDRPGNAQLDRVLKLTLESACFPYTNGQFLSGDPAAACLRALSP